MANWTRKTPWKQGCLISTDTLAGLNFDVEDHFGVVITHDCDLANDDIDTEPNVEIILAKPICAGNGNLHHAKNPRRLQLNWLGQAELPTLQLELVATDKALVRKEELANHTPVDGQYLDDSGKRVLQRWLAARYKRQALPDALQERLKKVFELLEKKGKHSADGILGYWLSFLPNEELSQENPYELFLNVVYTIDNPETADAADQIADTIKEKFSGLVKKQNKGDVHLSNCISISEEEFTLLDMRSNIEYRLEHISHKAYPNTAEID